MAASDELDEASDAEMGAEDGDEKQRLNLDVKIDTRGACQRHITVTIPRDDIDRYLDEALGELAPKAVVPGFRAGRAPRQLVKKSFHKQMLEQVKGTLLVDSLAQITDESKLAAISEPDFDPAAVTIPDEGSLTYEFDLEVRPEFDLPNWKGLSIERPTREFSDDDVEKQMQTLIAQHGKLVAFDGPASPGDYIATHLAFKNGDEVISSSRDEVIRLRPVLSFRDGKIDGFDKLMTGVRAGETREAKAKLTHDAPNAELRGKEVSAVFEVLEVKKLELPKLTAQLLEDLGGFGTEGELREAVRDMLTRRLAYQQQQRARQQILGALTVAADWDLPPELLRKQTQRELERAVLELQRSGYSPQEIRAHENELRQNSKVNTARALKEHFVLERIAEEEKIEAEPHDYDVEIRLIAQQSNLPARRVRAQLEKRNLMDTLRNQIIERKAIELILEHAKFRDTPFHLDSIDAEAVDQTAGGGEGDEAAIPDAKYGEEAQPRPNEPRKV